MTEFDDHNDSTLDAAIRFCGLFEAELLVELMLRYWEHPNADDRDYRNHLLEGAAELLNRSRLGEQFFEYIEPKDMNFVAAVWYVEWCQVAVLDDALTKSRKEWLTRVRRSIPACFCDPDDLVE